MSAPHVTITVNGSTAGLADKETLTQSLYMTYLQAVEGDRRHQWIVFPPAVEVLGVAAATAANSTGRVKVLHRTQEFEGNRSKWFHSTKPAEFVVTALEKALADGQKVAMPVIVALELDDYLAVWEEKTPHKAIRAVDREIVAVLKTTVK